VPQLSRRMAFMHEAPADLVVLQDLLDRSAAAAGSHMQSILTPERRLIAPKSALAYLGCPSLP
jgi:hypothetical protein